MMSSLFSCLIWPCIVSVPLVLTYADNFKRLIPTDWYDLTPRKHVSGVYPSPCGLILGILAVVIGQMFVLAYFCCYKKGMMGKLTHVERDGPPEYDLKTSMLHHLSQPEGFVMLGGYLTATWMFGLMPASYYSFSGGINWLHVALQLLLTDALQYTMHRLEHHRDLGFYPWSHKPHHRFINPKLFDAFDGSVVDTLCMILIPLFLTAQLVHTNVWSYMTFGALYANWLCLIHSEFVMPWDGVFRKVGFGTSSDHHVHHALYNYNYGHLFMYWDWAWGTYKCPTTIKKFTLCLNPKD